MIGYYDITSFDEDTINFININKHYTFNFIIWGSDDYSTLKKLENVNVYHSLKATTMMDMIDNSTFILSKKYINYDRFSGQLGLALSYEKPLLLDIKTKLAYNLPGITFTNQYSEIGNLDTIDINQYTRIQDENRILKLDILQKNKSVLHSLGGSVSPIHKYVLKVRRS